MATETAARITGKEPRPVGIINAVAIGRTGVGKSTIGNFFLSGKHDAPFKISADIVSCTHYTSNCTQGRKDTGITLLWIPLVFRIVIPAEILTFITNVCPPLGVRPPPTTHCGFLRFQEGQARACPLLTVQNVFP